LLFSEVDTILHFNDVARYDVYGIGAEALTDSIDREQINPDLCHVGQSKTSIRKFRLTHYKCWRFHPRGRPPEGPLRLPDVLCSCGVADGDRASTSAFDTMQSTSSVLTKRCRPTSPNVAIFGSVSV
jgi:hypothetical protein